MGVTSEHPPHSGTDWINAGDLAPGDLFMDSAMLPLTLLAIRVDDTPQLVHNLEVGGAHTYFAGEMGAWAHNSGLGGNPFQGRKWWEIAQMFRDKGFQRCSTRSLPGGVPQNWVNPRTGFTYFLDNSGFELPEMGDHVDVCPPSGRGGKTRLPL